MKKKKNNDACKTGGRDFIYENCQWEERWVVL